jgi:hypothetical protein
MNEYDRLHVCLLLRRGRDADPVTCRDDNDGADSSRKWIFAVASRMQQESSNGGQNRKDSFLPGSVGCRPMSETSTNVEQLKSTMLGTWVSIAPEIRPSKNPDGTLKPFYLTRSFVYQREDRFELTVMNYADSIARIAIAKIEIAGHMFWRGDHPIAPGAQKVDFVADEAYAVTRVSLARAALLGRTEHRRSRLRYGRESAHEPAGPDDAQAVSALSLARAWRPRDVESSRRRDRSPSRRPACAHR